MAGPVTLFRVAWCVTLSFTGCSFSCCAGYGLVVPAGFTHEPPGFWQHINSGFTVMRLNFLFQTLRLECVGYRLFQFNPWCAHTSVCFDFVFAKMALYSLV